MQIATFSKRHLLPWLTLVLVCCFGVLGVSAQTASQPLTANNPVAGSLDVQNVARVYTFTAEAGDQVNILAQSAEPLALMVTDSNGAVLGQNVGEEGAALSNLTASDGGTYFATVFAAPGSSFAESDYEITLFVGDVSPETLGTAAVEATEEAPAATESPVVATVVPDEAVATTEPDSTVTQSITFTPPSDVLMPDGMSVTLTWDADVDLNLNVRDPLGNALFWNSTTSPIGGTFGFDVNGLCEIISEGAAVETAEWTQGFLPTGSYEVLVFYRESCVTPAQPVTFTVQVTVNGVALEPVTGTLTIPPANQNSVFVTSYQVTNTDQGIIAEMGAAGPYPDTSLNVLPVPASTLQSNVQPIVPDSPVRGTIVNDQFYQAYTFDATANEIVSISLSRASGSLDTLLQVVDPSGGILDVNDDIDGTTTNSALTNLRLLTAGTYTLVATRYGKELGGSEGEFDLTLSGPTGDLPAEVATLGLPEGAIQVSLSWNSGADLQLLVRDPVGDAVFDDKPLINTGGILAVNGNVNCVRSANATPVSYIYWPPNFLPPGNYEIDVWYQSQCDDPTPVEFNLTTLINGGVLISERQRPTAVGQHYVVSFTVNNDGTASSREGGFITDETPSFNYSDAIPTTVNLNQPVTGQITSDDFYQAYAFNGTAGQQVTIAMSATTQALDTKLFLIDPNGVVVAQNDDAQPGTVKNSLINDQTLQETGQYLILATRYAMQYGGTVGGYTLTVSP